MGYSQKYQLWKDKRAQKKHPTDLAALPKTDLDKVDPMDFFLTGAPKYPKLLIPAMIAVGAVVSIEIFKEPQWNLDPLTLNQLTSAQPWIAVLAGLLMCTFVILLQTGTFSRIWAQIEPFIERQYSTAIGEADQGRENVTAIRLTGPPENLWYPGREKTVKVEMDPRISITARLIADLLQTAGATHIMTMTLHSPQVHGFFSVPTDPLTARPLFIWHFKQQNLNPLEAIVVSPDVGRAKPAARFAARIGLSVASAQKERISDSEITIGGTVERQVQGFKRALVYDDEIATGSTVVELCKLLVKCGITDISVVCTHGIFTGNALQRLTDFPQITEIVTTDTVPMHAKHSPKLKILSVAPIFGEAIWRNYNRQSIGELFPFGDEPFGDEAIEDDL